MIKNICIFSDREFMASSHLTTCFAFNNLPGESNFFNNNFSHLIPSNDKSPRRWVNFNSGLWYCGFCSNRILHYFPLSIRTTLTNDHLDHLDQWTTWDNLDILHHLDHSDWSNHFDNPDWSMIDQEDNCRIRIVYLVLFSQRKLCSLFD